MLELQTLLLQPWTEPGDTLADVLRAASATRIRPILDPADERLLGFAYEPSAASTWWPWLARPALEVYETEDASLLFTVHRYWALAPKWEVRDADGHRLGTFRQPLTRLLAPGSAGPVEPEASRVEEWCRRSSIHVEQSWRNPVEALAVASMDDLVALAHAAHGTLVTLADTLAGKPFAKMVVLAAVLSAEA